MKYTPEEVVNISNSLSLIDYFQHLSNQGKLKFEKKSGKDLYFTTEDNKFSVNENKFYDFKTGNGGQIIKAVMQFENKSWIEALEFIKNLQFNNSEIQEMKALQKEREIPKKEMYISKSVIPNNKDLLEYFENRGISQSILKSYTKQIHYENNDKKYFGIGLKNVSEGFEIRNPFMKTKLGKNDFTHIKIDNDKGVLVFEGMTDMLSFLQLLKDNNKKNDKSLVVLNSVTNVDSFIEHFKSYNGKLLLLLDGDKEGEKATDKIISNLKTANIKDIRNAYNISENGFNDLNEYLQNKIIQHRANENIKYTNSEISNFKEFGSKNIEQETGGIIETSKSEQNNNIGSRQNVDSNNVGDGSSASNSIGIGREGLFSTGENGNAQPNIFSNSEIIPGQEPERIGIDAGERRESGITRDNESENSLVARSTALEEEKLNNLRLINVSGRIENEDINSLVEIITSVNAEKEIVLNENTKNRIDEEILSIVSQYKSGGTAKEGRGILDEYYTDPKIVDAVRNLIKNRVHTKDEVFVLEPSIGTGNFLYAAKNIGQRINITGFEINETTAKIAKILHPEANIHLRSFETEFIDDRGLKKDFSQKYDLVIGNPPYGDHRGYYKGLGEEPKISRYEDYFVKRSLDVLKDGGVLAMVLPSSWLNNQKKLKNAELIEAYRLPNGAFKGTMIGTDIVLLKKNTQKLNVDISDYFEKNPLRVLGDLTEKTNRFGRLEPFVKGDIDSAIQLIELQREQQQNKIGSLFDFIENNSDVIEIPTQEKEVSISTEDFQDKIQEALVLLNQIKFKAPAHLLEIEKLSKFQKKAGEFSSEERKEIVTNIDKLSSKLIKNSNNEYRTETKPEIKKGILKYHFKKPDSIVDTALQNSSELSKEQISAFQDTDYDGTLNNHGKHYQFANYHDGKWVHDFYYAEGNIYAKLEQLEKDFADKFAVGRMENQYEKQKALLESVLPEPKNLEQIFMSPNHEFVHKFSLGQEEKEISTISGYDFRGRPSYTTEKQMVNVTLADKFKEFVGTLSSDAFAGSSAWEVRSFVDNESVTGSDKERNALVRERRKAAANDLFQKFLKEELSEELRESFVKEFNRNYNNIYVPDYSKFPLFSKIHENFKGQPLNLTEVQKAGIGRQTTKGVGLLAHEVGFGKTLSGILSMHEAMERGNAKRPLIVVPNESILKQWIETIFETIPDAKVNVLGNLGKDYDLSKFDNKDGEISIVTYEGFNNIGFKEDITQRLASKFSYISENELKSVNSISERDFQKELEKEKELVGKMKRGKIYDWEDFGFDHLTYDEVHNANHIVGKVRIEDRRFASDFRNQNQQTSKLGINTWMAAQYIQEQNDGRNVTLLSATPFTNKPLEYYSILSLIANKRLEESGYFNVNTFFETFMEADNDMEIDAKGDVKFKANVRRFKNNSLFQQLLSEFIDIKGEEDNPELKRPTKINKEYKIEQNDLTKEQYEMLNDNFSETQKGAILTHILNARLIAISPYLSPYYEDEEPTLEEFIENSPKLKQTMDLIRQNKKDLPNSGQIIYSELAVSEFPKLKEYLVKEIGYQPDEVGIITGATTKPNRLKIQEDFNEGKIKVVIGSEAIQEGMNLQKNTTDIYMLSLPYNFTSLRQVEGRAWRQGNENENVRINFMLTNDSIDVFMLQKLQSKQARYLEAMKKGADVLDISDISTQELKTAIITSPETRANIEIELLKKRIENQKSRYVADNAFILRKHESFLKVKEEVSKAQQGYNRVLGYTKENNGSAEYWKSQLPFYQKNIDAAKELVTDKIIELANKGINVEEIERQTIITDEKIAELDKKIENLPIIRGELVLKYTEEKQKQLLENQNLDYVKDRAEENLKLYRKDFQENIEVAEKESINYRRKR